MNLFECIAICVSVVAFLSFFGFVAWLDTPNREIDKEAENEPDTE